MATSAPITARKLSPLTRKQRPSPTAATTSPATDGPTTRAELNMAELSEMALSRSSLPVIWMSRDWRPGISKAFTTPSSVASTKICQTCTRPVSVNVASTKACNMASVCVTTTMRCRE